MKELITNILFIPLIIAIACVVTQEQYITYLKNKHTQTIDLLNTKLTQKEFEIESLKIRQNR